MSKEADHLVAELKRRFTGRHQERCSYLRVDIAPEGDQLVLLLRFTLDKARTWHRGEATIRLDGAEGAVLASRLEAGFAVLDDVIETARLAHLFRPLTAAQRMGVTRRA